MRPRALIDTGPLVAIFHAGDHHHQACVEQLASLRAPLLTCWPVVTEAAWLLRSRPEAVRVLLQALNGPAFGLLPLPPESAVPIIRVLDRFHHRRPQLADAALVHLAEREGIETIFTLDRRDFTVYRSSRDEPLQIVP